MIVGVREKIIITILGGLIVEYQQFNTNTGCFVN